MKKIIENIITVLAAAFMLWSCGGVEVNKKPVKKPFVITYKHIGGSSCNEGCSYKYTDANGNIVHFCEERSVYRIGDTIK